MTTARSQVAATNVATLIAAILLSGCNASLVTYRIDGAKTEFCVPHSIDVTPARPGQRDIVTGGFAINGCWNSDGNVCKGLENLVSMAVVERAIFTGRRLADFSSDAHVRGVAVQERARAKPIASNLLAVPDSVDAKKWFVWRVLDSNQTSVVNDDELMATCSLKNGVPGYFCDRGIVSPDYSVTYSFFVGSDLPTSFEPLDNLVLSGIEELRCR